MIKNRKPIDSTNLLKPQIKHVQTLVDSLNKSNFAFDASETGTGKTFSASAVAREVGAPTFVICPKAVIPSWKKVSKEFNVNLLAVKNYESLIRANKKSHYTSFYHEETDKVNKDGELIINKVLRFNKRIPADALIIFDEVHRCKALESTTSELLTTIREQGFKCLVLSASAATNPLEMKALGYVSKLHNHKDHNNFKRHWAQAMGAEYTGQFGTMTFDPQSPKALAGMKYVHDYFFKKSRCASRLTTKQMKSFFPDNHIMAESMDCGKNTDKINKVYDQMEAELAMLDEHSANYKPHIFSILMKARRHSELLKVPTFVEQITEAIQDGKSPAVFLNFNESIDAVVQRLEKIYGTKKSIRENGEIKIVTVRGGQSAEKRQQNIDDFQDNKARIIVCNLAAGGTGVSLHDLSGDHPRTSIISPSYSAINLLQALGRIFRANAKTTCIQKIIFAHGTIEEHACHRVSARLDCLSTLNAGDLSGLTIDIPTDISFD